MCSFYPDTFPSRLSSLSRRSRGKWSRRGMMVIGNRVLSMDMKYLVLCYSIPLLFVSTLHPLHLSFRLLAPSHPLLTFPPFLSILAHSNFQPGHSFRLLLLSALALPVGSAVSAWSRHLMILAPEAYCNLRAGPSFFSVCLMGHLIDSRAMVLLALEVYCNLQEGPSFFSACPIGYLVDSRAMVVLALEVYCNLREGPSLFSACPIGHLVDSWAMVVLALEVYCNLRAGPSFGAVFSAGNPSLPSWLLLARSLHGFSTQSPSPPCCNC